MALTMKQLTKLLDSIDFKYMEDAKRKIVMLTASGMHEHAIVISLQDDGRFLQFRSVNYLNIPKASPHLQKTLEILAEIDCRLRLIKFGWHPQSGRIVAFADMWVADGSVTQDQFKRMLFNYLTAMDLSYQRLAHAINQGEDKKGKDEKAEVVSL